MDKESKGGKKQEKADDYRIAGDEYDGGGRRFGQ